MRRRYVQDRETGKLVESGSVIPREPTGPAIVPDIEPFESPIDGRPIKSRRDLRVHQEEHDVRLHGEYGENNGKAYFERKQRERIRAGEGNTQQDRQERLRLLIESTNKYRR